MPYQPHTLITCGGGLTEQAANDEIWQVGIRGFNEGGGPVDPSELGALALHVALGDTGDTGLAHWWSAAHSWTAAGSNLAWVKCVNIGPTGAYTSDPQTYQWGTPIGGSSSPQAPSFNTVSLGWTTGKSFGRARSGRIYPPNYGATRGVGALITGSVQTDLVQSALEFLSAVDVDGDEYNFNPYVVSRSGVSNPITGVRVGNVYDTQRRRKDAVAEQYASSPR